MCDTQRSGRPDRCAEDSFVRTLQVITRCARSVWPGERDVRRGGTCGKRRAVSGYVGAARAQSEVPFRATSGRSGAGVIRAAHSRWFVVGAGGRRAVAAARVRAPPAPPLAAPTPPCVTHPRRGSRGPHRGLAYSGFVVGGVSAVALATLARRVFPPVVRLRALRRPPGRVPPPGGRRFRLAKKSLGPAIRLPSKVHPCPPRGPSARSVLPGCACAGLPLRRLISSNAVPTFGVSKVIHITNNLSTVPRTPVYTPHSGNSFSTTNPQF